MFLQGLFYSGDLFFKEYRQNVTLRHHVEKTTWHMFVREFFKTDSKKTILRKIKMSLFKKFTLFFKEIQAKRNSNASSKSNCLYLFEKLEFVQES